MPDALDFSPAKRSKAASTTANHTDRKTFLPRWGVHNHHGLVWGALTALVARLKGFHAKDNPPRLEGCIVLAPMTFQTSLQAVGSPPATSGLTRSRTYCRAWRAPPPTTGASRSGGFFPTGTRLENLVSAVAYFKSFYLFVPFFCVVCI